MPSSQSQYLESLLDFVRPFLRGELESVDENLSSLIAVLRSAGAGECSHKHGTFLEHLVDIYRILKIWKAPNSVCLCGLFHSAYSNAYVNLAIFDASTGRDVVRGHVGELAESLIHLFCVVPRQTMIHDNLLFKYSDSELEEHLKLSKISLKNAKEKGLFDRDEAWRKKLQVLLPENGIVVKNIKNGEDVLVKRKVMGIFLLMSMADYSDQFFGYQDLLFDNFDGKFRFWGNNYAALWPGDGKPGLWMNSISKMGAVYTLILRDEGIIMEEKKRFNGSEVENDILEGLDLVVPPVFENCTKVLDAKEQVEARDLYWEAICEGSKSGVERAEELLLRCSEKNPFVGEPHVVLAQVYLNQGRYEEAEKEAERGLTVMLEWGSPWNKRTSWEGWIAWARVLLLKAKEKSWPHSAWGVLSLGLVRLIKNAMLCKSIDKLFLQGSDAVDQSALKGLVQKATENPILTGFSMEEIFRKYIRYSLNEKPWSADLLASLIQLRKASMLYDSQVAEILNEISRRIVHEKGPVVMDMSGFTEKGFKRKLAAQDLFGKVLYLLELPEFCLSEGNIWGYRVRPIPFYIYDDADKLQLHTFSEAGDMDSLEKMVEGLDSEYSSLDSSDAA